MLGKEELWVKLSNCGFSNIAIERDLRTCEYVCRVDYKVLEKQLVTIPITSDAEVIVRTLSNYIQKFDGMINNIGD